MPSKNAIDNCADMRLVKRIMKCASNIFTNTTRHSRPERLWREAKAEDDDSGRGSKSSHSKSQTRLFLRHFRHIFHIEISFYYN